MDIRKMFMQGKAIAEAIRELGTVPSGHLYARVMNYVTLEEYNEIIGALKSACVVVEKNNLLIWNG